jgi:ring-1,2-phenylacetyl-CoA epoxidase subunit PaaD
MVMSNMAAVDATERALKAWHVLEGVLDPEVPVVSVVDLGIVREVVECDDGALGVVLTPTYSGCPATEAIEQSVRDALAGAGFDRVVVRLQRAPAWTTDWISAEGRRKLREYGIAPPAGAANPEQGVAIRLVRREPALSCPQCDSANTERLSAYGSTACKALYRCRACGEPFEHFKAI